MGWLPDVPDGMLETRDPWVVIEEQRTDYVRYRCLFTGERWIVRGTCAWTDPTSNGPCEEGAVTGVAGPPWTRLDIPVTPRLDCSLCVDGGHLTFETLPPMQEPLPYQEYVRAENERLAAV